MGMARPPPPAGAVHQAIPARLRARRLPDLARNGGAGSALREGARIVRTAPVADPPDIAAPAHKLASAISPGDVAMSLHTLSNGLTGTGPGAPSVHEHPDEVSRLLDTTAELSDRVSTTLRGHGANIGHLIDGAGRTLAAMRPQRQHIPTLIESLDELFGSLAGLIRIPGPEGRLLTYGTAPLPLAPCQTFIDLCTP
ncbi:hypothetical protein [Actinomadura yumaensis]|uniref:MCE family protein n=1 Tax=Actinomadura yumaensis TaxID=111807 RepID=A0ABW2CL87_9ACTN|nr:hypothetical protein [Actinomadura sp. J1-007]